MTAVEADVYRVVSADGYEIKPPAGTISIRLRQDQAARPASRRQLLVQSARASSARRKRRARTPDRHDQGDGTSPIGQRLAAAILNFWGDDRDLRRVSPLTSTHSSPEQPSRHDLSRAPVAVPERNTPSFFRCSWPASRNYGFAARTKHSVPEVIWRGSEACVRAYLQGLSRPMARSRVGKQRELFDPTRVRVIPRFSRTYRFCSRTSASSRAFISGATRTATLA